MVNKKLIIGVVIALIGVILAVLFFGSLTNNTINETAKADSFELKLKDYLNLYSGSYNSFIRYDNKTAIDYQIACFILTNHTVAYVGFVKGNTTSNNNTPSATQILITKVNLPNTSETTFWGYIENKQYASIVRCGNTFYLFNQKAESVGHNSNEVEYTFTVLSYTP